MRRALKGIIRQDLYRSVILRGALLPVSGIASVLTSKLVATATGIEGYASYALLLSLPAVVPFSDFGIAAAVTDSAARDGAPSPVFRATYRAALSRLIMISVVGLSILVIVTVLGIWPPILGLADPVQSSLGALAVLTCLMLMVPLSIGQRTLLGVGRQALAIAVVAAGSVSSLIFCFILFAASVDKFAAFALAFALGPLLAHFILWRLSVKYAGGPDHPEGFSVKLGNAALPMLVISVALPIAYQSDRILLANVSHLIAVAEYSLVGALFFPLLSIVQMGGQVLWPEFIRARSAGESVRSQYLRAVTLFTILGFLLVAGLLALGPVLANFIADHEAPMALYFCFAILLLMFAIATPSGMLLMTPTGRMLQAVGSALTLIVKIALTVWWSPLLGAVGSVAATIVAAGVFMILPNLYFASRFARRLPMMPRWLRVRVGFRAHRSLR